MDLMARISDNLRHARRTAGLTQQQLAKRAGIGEATVARIEAEKLHDPRISVLQKLAGALGLEVKDLLEDT